MDFIAILIGLGPLLGWGLFPTIASKFGGRPVNQIFGATVGTLIFAIVLALFKGIGLPGGMALVFSLISGAGWAFGQIITFKAFELVGSSRAMPITTAFQLLGASLWGVLRLATGRYNKQNHWISSFTRNLIGARMTVWTETKQQEYSKIYEVQ